MNSTTDLTLTNHIVPHSEWGTFAHQISSLQIESHFITKGMGCMEQTELFLFSEKEITEVIKKEMATISTIKKGVFFTQEVAGFGLAICKDIKIANQLFCEIRDKLIRENGEDDFIICDVFMKNGYAAGTDVVKMSKKLEESIKKNTKTPIKVYYPIHTLNQRFKGIQRIFRLNFEQIPSEIISTKKNGVINLPHKIIKAV